MSTDIMCNGHKYVKSSLFQSPRYLADLSPYISAVISSRLLATPIQITANAIKPLGPLAHSFLPSRATNFILSGTLTCEHCLHQVTQESYDDGRPCPTLILEKLTISDTDFVLADQLIEAQTKIRVARENERITVRDSETGSLGCQEVASNTTTNAVEVTITNTPDAGQQATPNGAGPDVSQSTSERSLSRDTFHQFKQELLIMQICPEIGLHAQGFVCVDCDKEIDFNTSRLCHYDGRHYCYQCHTGSDLLPIPARVMKNWDFTPKPVSKTSLQKICYLRTKPVLFNLFEVNSMLYGFIDRLVEIKHIRERLQSMLKYIEVCGQPDRPQLISVPKHFLSADLLNFFTLNDLFDINQVCDVLNQLQTTLENHIVRKCESCRGKGFYCELCRDPHDVLYPFTKNGSTCPKCHTVYHKNCFHRRKKNCPKCIRLDAKRSSIAESSTLNSAAESGQESDVSTSNNTI